MTQGYGPENGSQPQRGQTSPTAAPDAAGAPAPGAAGSASTVADLVRWMFYGVLALIAVRLLITVVDIGIRAAGYAVSSADMAGVTGIFSLLGMCVNGLVSLAVLVVAIMVVIRATGRGRTGAIVVVATIVLAVIAFWIVHGTFLVLMANSSSLDSIAVMVLVATVAQLIRSLIVFAALIIGAMMSRRWAAQHA